MGLSAAFRGVRAALTNAWKGKTPIEPMMCHMNFGVEGLVVCKTHPGAEKTIHGYHGYGDLFRASVADKSIYEADRVLQGIHDISYGPNSGHFCSRDPVIAMVSAGSLNAMKIGTLPAHPSTLPKFGKACLHLDDLAPDALLAIREGSDLFDEWPLGLTMHSGYSIYALPSEINRNKLFMFEMRPWPRIAPEGLKEYHMGRCTPDVAEALELDTMYEEPHACQERVVLDRPRYIHWALETKKKKTVEEAEMAADSIRFKVAVELDLSALQLPNMLFFVYPEHAKDPSKVVEEMMRPVHADLPKLPDMNELRLVPHPHYNHCNASNWFKVVPKNRRLSWE